MSRRNLSTRELASSSAPDLLGRFIPVPYNVYLETGGGLRVLLETNDCMLISQAVMAGARIVRGNAERPFRWRILRDWKRPAHPIGTITSLRTDHVFHVSLGSGSTFCVDTEFREAYGFFGLEVKQTLMVRHIFPLLTSLSVCALHPEMRHIAPMQSTAGSAL